MAIHRGNDGFADGVVEVRPGLDEVIGVGVGEGFGGHFFDVGAGGEGFLGAREDGGADGGVGVEGAEGGVKVGYEGGEEGVEGFGAVELD